MEELKQCLDKIKADSEKRAKVDDDNMRKLLMLAQMNPEKFSEELKNYDKRVEEIIKNCVGNYEAERKQAQKTMKKDKEEELEFLGLTEKEMSMRRNIMENQMFIEENLDRFNKLMKKRDERDKAQNNPGGKAPDDKKR